MSEFTQKQIDDYVASGGDHCPYCGSMALGGVSFDYCVLTQEVECLSCKKSWTACLKVVDIAEAED